VANELLADRSEVFKHNYPECTVITGDIWENQTKIIEQSKKLLGNRALAFMLATPPCQGMSKNGRGKLLNLIREGKKGKFDKRNELVIPTINIAKSLNVETLVMENVPEMENTLIPVGDRVINILEYIAQELGGDYIRECKVIEFANYGVPQRRQRLISIFTRNSSLKEHFKKHNTLFPAETHSKDGSMIYMPWITLKETLKNLPKLDASCKSLAICKEIPYHKVPVLSEEKYLWIKSTPLNATAFDNQCINPDCRYDKNQTHQSKKNVQGINRSSSETPLYCEKCSSLLPRPWVKDDRGYRLMKGFTSAYKRMNPDLPANTLTRNLSYACSDNKIHPTENRVLSLHEAMKIHTITDFDYRWERSDGKKVSDKLIREVIGEGIPPMGFYVIIDHIHKIIAKK
jgi:DNA (cytosine-5)-methyltransferase 1